MAHRLQFEDLILFQDDDYIVVNKPPFLSTLEDRQENVNLLSLEKRLAHLRLQSTLKLIAT
jgi:23S rRNA-/tRNA-specific pseudouridylate synthase